MKTMKTVKMLAVLGAIGVVAVLLNPGLLQYLPLLLLAICPLSMIFMGGHAAHMGMGGQASREPQQASGATGAGEYTCPMHSDVRRDSPGRCPKCGMALVPGSRPAGEAVARQGDVGQLEVELRSLNERQTALAREIERIKRSQPPPAKAIREAEEVARAAEKQPGPD